MAGPALVMDQSDVAAWVAATSGRAVEALERVGYGASRATYLVQTTEPPYLVVRRDTGDGPMAGTELSLAREAEVYRALAATGVRIPHLYAMAPDGSALLVERAGGTHDLGDLAGDPLHAVLDDYMDALADLHAVDPSVLHLPSFRRPSADADHAGEELSLWGEILRSRTKRPWPLAYWTLQFLRRHAPRRAQRTVLCHGDVGPGNFMHDGRRVTALLDWEFCHLGDPMDDLAWWVFRGHDMRGGCGDLTRQLRRYSARSGRAVDGRSIDYYRIMVMLRWLVSVAAALDSAGRGMDRSVYFGLVPVLSVRLPAAMAAYAGIPLGDPPDGPPSQPTAAVEVLDALASDLENVVAPALQDPEAKRRLVGATMYLSHLRSSDAVGAAIAAADLDDLAGVVGRRPDAPDGGLTHAGAELIGSSSDTQVLPYFWRNGLRQLSLWPQSGTRALAPVTAVPEGIEP